MKLFRRQSAAHGLPQRSGQPLDESDSLDGKSPGASVVQLKQAEGGPPGVKGDERHRLVPRSVAAVPGACLAVGLGCARQKLGRRVRPETAVGREKRQRGIESAAEDVAAHALQGRVALEIAGQLAIQAAHAEGILGLNELRRKPAHLEVREVVAVAQSNAHGFAAGPLPQQQGRLPHQAVQVVGGIGQMHEPHGHGALSLQFH